MTGPWTESDARPVVSAAQLVAAEAAVRAGAELGELRAALRDIRVILLDGLGAVDLQRDHLREIAKVMSRPTIARFTRGT